MFYANFKGIPGNGPILSLAANGKVRPFQEAWKEGQGQQQFMTLQFVWFVLTAIQDYLIHY